MPKLIQNIEGEILDYFVGNVYTFTPIVGQIGQEDYVNLFGLIAYLQNLTRAEEVTRITKPYTFGLTNNKTMVTIEISY